MGCSLFWFFRPLTSFWCYSMKGGLTVSFVQIFPVFKSEMLKCVTKKYLFRSKCRKGRLSRTCLKQETADMAFAPTFHKNYNFFDQGS